MANDAVLSASSRANLLSLQGTQKSIDATQLRLATGKKVNSALDNPQSFFQSQSLNNRASDLTRLLDGIGQSIRSIEEADKGITALTNLVDQASSIAQEAQSVILASQGFSRVTGDKDLSSAGALYSLGGGGIISATSSTFNVVYTSYDATSDIVTEKSIAVTIAATDTVDNIVAKINADTNNVKQIKASVGSGGQLVIQSLVEGASIRLEQGATNPLSAGAFTALGFGDFVSAENTPGAGTTQQGATSIAGNVLKSTVSNAGTVNGKYQASAQLQTAAGAAGFVSTAATAFNLSITIDGTQTTVTPTALTGASTIQQMIDSINTSGLGDKLTASFNVDTGQIELAFGKGVGKAEIEFVNTVAGAVGFGFGSGEAGFSGGTTRVANGTSAAGVPDALTAGQSTSEQFVFAGTTADLEQYTSDYNKIRTQIDAIVKDANYRGTNLLAGDNLTTFFNEDRSSSLVTTGADFSALGLGLAKANFTTNASIQISIDDVSEALEKVRAFGSSIANDLSIIQTRQTFTQETINTLKAGSADLVNADLNEEGANLLALQTAQQLGVTSLSLASQSQQSVLRLF